MDEKFTVKIAGTDDTEFSSLVTEWSVDTNIFLPSMFTIVIRDEPSESAKKTLKYTDNQARIKIGSPIEITVATEAISSQSVKSPVFTGEITAIEPIFGENGSIMLRLRGFDLGHRLTMGKNTRTFGDASPQKPSLTDSQIVTQIAKKSKLNPKIVAGDLGNLAYHYVMQYDQNDWDFLWARAQMLGYQVYVEDKTLHFRPASDKRYETSPATLIWGTNLRRFEPRIVSSAQVAESSAWGWDPSMQQQVKANAKTNSKKTSTINESMYGEKSVTEGLQLSDVADAVVYPVIRDNNVSNVIAKARFAQHQSQFVRASGEMLFGDPRLLAGCEVEVKNVGERFSGNYYVTEAHHTWRKGDYRVRFEVSGQNPYTLRSLLLGRDSRSQNKVNGVVIGVVTDTMDPQKLGRVKVKYPWLPPDGGAELSSNWARLVAPGAGKDRGIFFVPEISDEVLITFEQGDVNYPYIVGALWSDKQTPPEGESGDVVVNGTTNQRIVRSRSGHVIIFDDTDGSEKITVMDKTRNNTITIDSKDNSMTLKTKGDLTLDAEGKMIFKCKQDFSLETNAQASFKAQTATSIKTGSAELDLKPSGATLQAPQISIKGNGPVEIKGTPISIN